MFIDFCFFFFFFRILLHLVKRKKTKKIKSACLFIHHLLDQDNYSISEASFCLDYLFISFRFLVNNSSLLLKEASEDNAAISSTGTTLGAFPKFFLLAGIFFVRSRPRFSRIQHRKLKLFIQNKVGYCFQYNLVS